LEDNKEINHYKNTRQEQIFKKFLDMLDVNYANQRSVNYYANSLNITPKYLSSTTMAFTGLPASKIIDNFVVFQIKQQLYINKKSVKTISKELNFQSQSFFGRYFKRITGYSPREYINTHSTKRS
jgi:AraC-like DNA-binding protein